MWMVKEKLQNFVKMLETRRYMETREIPAMIKLQEQPGHDPTSDIGLLEGLHIEPGQKWADRDERVWLSIPLAFEGGATDGSPVALLDFGVGNDSNTRGWEGIIYIDGKPYQGVDRMHREVVLPQSFISGPSALPCYMWSGLADPYQVLGHNYQAVLDSDVDQLYFTLKNIMELCEELGESDPLYHQWLQLANRIAHAVDPTVPDEAFISDVRKANADVETNFPQWPSSQSLVQVTAVGHTHIDLAWLWRLQDTREKAYRSFSTVLHFMKHYPSYHFVQSQPQIYEYIAEDHPEVFAEIAQRVHEGRWEPVGSLWVESDTNLPSGEALVRQILVGSEFFEKHFGTQTPVAWLPDTFGFSAALPQILFRAGIHHFVTTKLSWNQQNRMPDDTFYWRGLDGSQVTAHFITTPAQGSEHFSTYNGNLNARSLRGIWQEYRNKPENNQLLLAYGWGDGGGGPTRDMLEDYQQLRRLSGVPALQDQSVGAYLAALDQRLAEADHVPVWEGELYLEYHRGTYTSQAKVKWFNRKLERRLHDVEVLWTQLAHSAGSVAYPSEEIAALWKILLRYQFHDILPGSAIGPVYSEAHEQYALAMEKAQQLIDRGLATYTHAGSGPRVLVYNGLLAHRHELLEVPAHEGSWQTPDGTSLLSQSLPEDGGTARTLVSFPEIPSGGLAVLVPNRQGADEPRLVVRVSEQKLETPWFVLRWNDVGQLTSWFDKHANREVLAPGTCANVFQVFEDLPLNFDAWDIDAYYEEKQQVVTELLGVEVVERGPLRARIHFTWKFRASVINQWLTAYHHEPRIDFVTEVDWHEHHQLLKVAFPVNIHSTTARYAIQFGNIERPTVRNTSWDRAKFEVPGHHWADYSEGDYGVALLNDSKYGYDIHDGSMRLTLLKSATFPDPDADQGHHEFVYALYPHQGSFVEARVHETAERLNSPCCVAVRTDTSERESQVPALTHGFWVEGNHVWLDTLKPTQDGSPNIVIRLYEFGGLHGLVNVHVPAMWKTCQAVTLTEIAEEAPQIIPGGVLTLDTAPYVIYSFLLRS